MLTTKVSVIYLGMSFRKVKSGNFYIENYVGTLSFVFLLGLCFLNHYMILRTVNCFI